MTSPHRREGHLALRPLARNLRDHGLSPPVGVAPVPRLDLRPGRRALGQWRHPSAAKTASSRPMTAVALVARPPIPAPPLGILSFSVGSGTCSWATAIGGR